MKKIDWKILIATCTLCLLPMLLGIYYYNRLPDQIAIHFNINNEPDNYASKSFTLFGLPLIMLGFQVFGLIVTDLIKKQEKQSKLTVFSKWIIPIITIVVYIFTLLFALERIVDIRRIACLVISALFMIIGNYLPKISFEEAKGKMHPMPKNEKVFRKYSRSLGYTMILFGIGLAVSCLGEPKISALILAIFAVLLIFESVYFVFKNE